MTDPSFACHLSSEDVPARASQFDRLAARLRSSRRDGPTRAEFTFPASTEDDVRAFVRDESACCSFFRFEVTTDRDTVRLTVDAPAAAAPMLDAVAAGFQPGPSRADREQALRDLSSGSVR